MVSLPEGRRIRAGSFGPHKPGLQIGGQIARRTSTVPGHTQLSTDDYWMVLAILETLAIMACGGNAKKSQKEFLTLLWEKANG